MELTTLECVQEVQQLGYTEYHNICNGIITKVPWGIMGWIAIGIITFIIIVFIVIIIKLKEY